jgi:hypothetical protein
MIEMSLAVPVLVAFMGFLGGMATVMIGIGAVVGN